MKDCNSVYAWLESEVSNNKVILTVSQRLANDLKENYTESQIKKNKNAWNSPKIYFWKDWLRSIFLSNSELYNDVLIDKNLSLAVWEQCLQQIIDDPLINLQNLALVFSETLKQISDWCVPLSEISASSYTQEEKLFIKTTELYLKTLNEEDWIDHSLFIERMLNDKKNKWLESYNNSSFVFVGFHETTPIVKRLMDSIQLFCKYKYINKEFSSVLYNKNQYIDSSAEYRAIGSWAKNILSKNPNAKIGILVNKAYSSERTLPLIKEGLMPGWQLAEEINQEIINTSYGLHLHQYPIIYICNLILNWYRKPLSSKDICFILRSSLFQNEDSQGSNTLEHKIRLIPIREWTVEQFIDVMKKEATESELNVLEKFKIIANTREISKDKKELRDWIGLIKKDIERLGWPGIENFDNNEQQLLKRWNELLIEIDISQKAHSRVTLSYFLKQLINTTEKTIFRPETLNNLVSIMDHSEAIGLEFDYLWLSGMDNQRWPSIKNQLSFISLELQKKYNIQNLNSSTWADSQKKFLGVLSKSAKNINYSWPVNRDDMELSFTTLIDIDFNTNHKNLDPGWYVTSMLDGKSHISVIEEPSFEVSSIEYLKGGTNTIQMYLDDPFLAFALGRLKISKLAEFSRGISSLMRGNLVHASLANLFSSKPSLDDLNSWADSKKKDNVKNAIDIAFAGQLKQSNDVLQRTLILHEKKRTEKLMLDFISNEMQRDNFKVTFIEENLKLKYANLKLSLKVDRIDKYADGSFCIIDYKTGITKKILTNKQSIKSIQLFVYAAAFKKTVSALSFVTFNNDNEIIIDLVRENSDQEISNNTNQIIKEGVKKVYSVIKKISSGDNRVHVDLHSKNVNNPYRFLHVLSRIKERIDGYS
ncbi:MAG: PD-(D/E)XK nuclease family protein [Pseudomonadota bacterium]|nr:PD-(D/E)XK nuclease family protein [Pseudomonadota bacterium]